MTDFLHITTTAGSREEANQVARALVERRLAGCVQIVGPIKSVYRWGGQVEQGEEWLCLIKTGSDQFAAVEAVIGELSTYECPEIIATPITAGSTAYLSWLGRRLSSGEGE
jgi:periplasmic divalent cation tolerance protein